MQQVQEKSILVIR